MAVYGSVPVTGIGMFFGGIVLLCVGLFWFFVFVFFFVVVLFLFVGLGWRRRVRAECRVVCRVLVE